MGRKSNNQQGKKGGKVMDASQLARKVLNFLDNNYGKEFNAKQIIKKLEIRDSVTKGGVEPTLHKLAAAGSVSKTPRNYFSSVKEPEFVEGEVDFVNPRFAFIKPDPKHDLEEDVMVKEADLKHALDGDRVRIMVYPTKGSSGRLEGKVLEIVQRNRDEFVGRIEISPRYAFVVPDFKKMHHDIFVHLGDLGGAQHNQKVVVKLSDWREDDKNPTGKIIRVLGKAGEHDVEIHTGEMPAGQGVKQCCQSQHGGKQ
jgi:ribonuclease R